MRETPAERSSPEEPSALTREKNEALERAAAAETSAERLDNLLREAQDKQQKTAAKLVEAQEAAAAEKKRIAEMHDEVRDAAEMQPRCSRDTAEMHDEVRPGLEEV